MQIIEIHKNLKVVIDSHYEQINNSINWSEWELMKLDEIKSRNTKHYNRWKNTLKTCKCGVVYIRYGFHQCEKD